MIPLILQPLQLNQEGFPVRRPLGITLVLNRDIFAPAIIDPPTHRIRCFDSACIKIEGFPKRASELVGGVGEVVEGFKCL